MTQITIVGIDCAVDPSKTGLALGYATDSRVVIKTARCASRRERPVAVVADWLRGSDRALLALDAPLGWPEPMHRALATHMAGEALVELPDPMFRRLTDNQIYARYGKRSFDVGANLIARTAHAALTLLAELSGELGQTIPLAWSPRYRGNVAAIEVYPAATRRSANGHTETVDRFIQRRTKMTPAQFPSSEHALDAIICVIAGADFLEGNAVGPLPAETGLAKKEGWIWVAKRQA